MNPQNKLKEILASSEKTIQASRAILWVSFLSLFLPLLGIGIGAFWVCALLALFSALGFRYRTTSIRNRKIQDFVSRNTETGIVLQNFTFSRDGAVTYIPFSDITHVYAGSTARFPPTLFAQIEPQGFKKGREQIPNIFANLYGHICLARLRNQEIYAFPNNSTMQSSNVLMYSNADVLKIKCEKHGISYETGSK